MKKIAKQGDDALQLYHKLRDEIREHNEHIIQIGERRGEDEAELETEMEVVRISLNETKVYGLVLQRALWNLVRWQLDGERSYSLRYQVQNLKELIEQQLGGDDYAMRQVHVIIRIFLPLYQAAEGLPLISEMGQPILDKNGEQIFLPPLTHPETGEVLTPEHFLDSTGNIQKLKIISSHFENAIASANAAAAQEWIDRVVEETTGQIKDQIRQLNAGTSFKFRIRRKYVTKDGQQLIQPEIEPMDEEQYLAFISRLGDYIEES